ncbi:phenylacetaldoxime dehydratase family protein [Shewanella corallii]|uniref:Phenylacetaldoxime dehydratase family protein n=1 Tax=Shewanella corallii TaxID=560080 RepID=A0ABT0NDV0_9GAMM|nr:phenylacetaldoxime dehydratase family protein [Shewanella corallii]MCL2916021.1 phenylacetaldoxime dehydratase family protein [Shewanella corallii]
MHRNNMPENWQPPAPAWAAKWQGESNFVVAYFGCQSSCIDSLSEWAINALNANHGPLRIEQGTFTDNAGVSNHLYIAYWLASEYQQWWNCAANNQWWRDEQREQEGVGFFREIISMPIERFETLHSTTTPHGISTTAQTLEGPIMEHGYAGAMRDRIPLSATESLQNQFDASVQFQATRNTNNKRVIVTPPENLCVIRSGQNWSECDEEQKRMYLSKVHPTLKKGMAFLQNNPAKSGCLSMRFVDVKDENWQPMEQSFGLGLATDIYAFEEWAKSHATHLAIFERFMEMVMTFGDNLQLKLWHEVSVLPAEECEFEYINCHPETGLLKYC